LNTLRRREPDSVLAQLSAETGLAHERATEGELVAGVYRRRVTLASDRFAMIDDGLGFQLVPWRPALEPKHEPLSKLQPIGLLREIERARARDALKTVIGDAAQRDVATMASKASAVIAMRIIASIRRAGPRRSAAEAHEVIAMGIH
jgi:hypothetical protein